MNHSRFKAPPCEPWEPTAEDLEKAKAITRKIHCLIELAERIRQRRDAIDDRAAKVADEIQRLRSDFRKVFPAPNIGLDRVY